MKLKTDRLFRAVLIFCLYYVCSTITLNIFFASAGYRGNHPLFGFKKMVDFDSHRPFAYRVLSPCIINAVDYYVPNRLKTFILKNKLHHIERMKVLANAYGQRLWGDGYDFKKFIAYYYMFIALLALLYSMNILLGKYLLLPDSYKEIAPVIFILFYPLTFLHGGFVYDFPEFLFIVIYLILLRSEFKILPTLVYGLAILNKESNVLLIIYDFTINYKNYDKKNIFPVAIKMIFGLSIFIFTRVLFLNNPGAGMDYRPMFNLQFYTTLKTYLSFNFVYGGGILFPKSFNIINLAIIFYLIGHKWPVAPKNLRMSLMIMTSILIPLTILFGYIDEIRNYSLIFPIVFLLTSNTIYTIYNEKQS